MTLTIFGSWPCELLRDAITHSFAPSMDELRQNLMQNMAVAVPTLAPSSLL